MAIFRSARSLQTPEIPPPRNGASQKRVERTRIEKSDFDEVISYDIAPIK